MQENIPTSILWKINNIGEILVVHLPWTVLFMRPNNCQLQGGLFQVNVCIQSRVLKKKTRGKQGWYSALSVLQYLCIFRIIYFVSLSDTNKQCFGFELALALKRKCWLIPKETYNILSPIAQIPVQGRTEVRCLKPFIKLWCGQTDGAQSMVLMN